MIGTYQHTIDAKGRIFIPARLKEELGDTFYVTISMEKCLTAYSNESWDLIMEKFRARKKSEQVKLRPLFAHAAKCEPDGQGRVLIPQKLRDFAGLDKNVAIVGMGEYAELWDADAWAAVEAIETTPEYMADVFTELDF